MRVESDSLRDRAKAGKRSSAVAEGEDSTLPFFSVVCLEGIRETEESKLSSEF